MNADSADSWFIPSRPGLEVYVGTHGHVVLKQHNWPDPDDTIIVDPWDVSKLVEHLQAAAAVAKENQFPMRGGGS